VAADAVRAVEVEGHTSIRDARVELGPINVLIGANGAGKSNFIRVLELLGRIVDQQLALYVRRSGGASLLFNRSTGARRIRLKLDGRPASYEAILEPSVDDGVYFAHEVISPGEGGTVTVAHGGTETWLHTVARGGTKTFPYMDSDFGLWFKVAKPVIRSLRGCRVYHFHDTGPQSSIKAPAPTADNLTVHGDGSNVSSVLIRLRDSDDPEDVAAYRRISGVVRQVAPFFRDFVLEPERSDRIRLRWREADSDTVFSAHQMSDGTLRFVCLATLLLQPKLPALVVVDEPELGLHPYGITQLAGLIRQASERSQVLLATQSVTLVNEFDIEDLIVVEREDGASTFSRPDRERFTAWPQDYSLGELWQKNVIGGRPGPAGRGIA
jgi:predicted ATPase